MQAIGNSLVVYDPAVAIAQAKAARTIVVSMRDEVLRKDVDYGVIPGTGKDKNGKDREVLFKPGAERLCSAFGFCPEFELIGKVEEWTPDKPLFNYQYRCRLVHIETGKTIATGIGSCNSMESKYRWRNGLRVCPECGKANIRKSKDKPEFYCWKKSDGCGATFKENDERITSQPEGKVENKDIFDQVNTLDKMAQKRALIAATLIGCNASEFFTQDMEDLARKADEDGVIDADIVEEPAKSKVELPPKHWIDDQEKLDYCIRYLKGNLNMTWEEAKAFVEKTDDLKAIREYQTVKEFCQAIEQALAASKPAAPKNGAKLWYDDRDENIAFSAFVGRFGRTPIKAAEEMGIKDFHHFDSRDKAESAIRQAAYDKCWYMLTDKAEYKEREDGKKAIVFLTPLNLTWWKGRHELADYMKGTGAAEEDWTSVGEWTPGEHDLPEMVRIISAKDGDKLIIERIESAKAIPF